MQDKPKPPMKCVPIGKNFPPNEGADKWALKKDHTVEVLDEEFQTIAEGGWRNKVFSLWIIFSWPAGSLLLSLPFVSQSLIMAAVVSGVDRCVRLECAKISCMACLRLYVQHRFSPV